MTKPKQGEPTETRAQRWARRQVEASRIKEREYEATLDPRQIPFATFAPLLQNRG